MDGKISDEQLAEAMRVAKAAASAMPAGSTSEQVNEAAIRAVLGLRFQPACVTVKGVDRYDMYANHDGERAWPSPELAAQGEWVKFVDLPTLETQEEEAVAWRYRQSGSAIWHLTDDGPKVRGWKAAYGYEVHPLYAHPAPVQKEEEGQTVSEEMVETENFREPGEFGDGATMRRERE